MLLNYLGLSSPNRHGEANLNRTWCKWSANMKTETSVFSENGSQSHVLNQFTAGSLWTRTAGWAHERDDDLQKEGKGNMELLQQKYNIYWLVSLKGWCSFFWVHYVKYSSKFIMLCPSTEHFLSIFFWLKCQAAVPWCQNRHSFLSFIPSHR